MFGDGYSVDQQSFIERWIDTPNKELKRFKYLQPGSSVLLACEVGENWPVYRNITWTLNSVPLAWQLSTEDLLEEVEATASRSGHVMLLNGSLYLWNIPLAANDGIYQCHASSLSGVVQARSPQTQLVVSKPGKNNVNTACC